jgi:molybdopterin molybdotransferase
MRGIIVIVVTGQLSIDDALALVLARVQPLDAEDVSLHLAAGRVLAEPGRAAIDLPPFDSSAMDGFAVRAEDTPGRLPLMGRSAAGRPYPGTLPEGAAVAISTGAVVPPGADAIVPLEEASLEAGNVVVAGAEPGAHLRSRGGDAPAGAVVVPGGVRLRPAELGALAAAGIASIRAFRRPRVAVLATGSELQQPGSPLAPGEIYEANTPLLTAQLGAAGADVDVLTPVADDAEATTVALATGMNADVLVTSGGVSVGPHDLVRASLAELGVEEVFWRVDVRPGRPIAFGVRGRTLVFGLPGNPVSSLVGCELFVRPAVLALQGAAEPGPPFLPARLGAAVRRDPRRVQLLRARLRVEPDGVVLDPLRGQESHMIATSAGAAALVRIEAGVGELPAGSPVRYLNL